MSKNLEQTDIHMPSNLNLGPYDNLREIVSCFPESVNLYRDEVEVNIDIRGKAKFIIFRWKMH